MADAPGPTSAAHAHQQAHPAHAVRPYLDLDAKVHWACDGTGGLDEPGDCGFEAPIPTGGITMTLVNLTPHPINLYGANSVEDGPREVIPPSGAVARVATIELGSQVGDGGSYELVEYGHLDGVPAPQPGIQYVVSLVAALAARGRDDLLAPYVEVRNDSGTMIGCRYLQRVC